MIWRKCLSALCNSKEDLHDYNNWRSGSAGHCGARDKFSRETGRRYVQRGGHSLRKLARRFGDDDVLVVLNGHVRLSGPDGSVMEFHPSMGFVRLKRVLSGKPDPMLEASGMEEGIPYWIVRRAWSRLLVFSGKGGPNSRITALESSLPYAR